MKKYHGGLRLPYPLNISLVITNDIFHQTECTAYPNIN